MKAPTGFRGRFSTDQSARAAYAEGAGIYRIIPAAVAIPADREDLVRLVTWAGETRTPLVPRGAGSGMPGGNVGPGVVVDLTAGFRGPLTIAPAGERLIQVPAGRTAAELADAARPSGLRLPVDPSSQSFCTLGGMTATNAAGPRSRRYGSMRRWVEGVEAVMADGTVRWIRRDAGSGMRDAGPWRPDRTIAGLVRERFPVTRKNSSGYALDAYFDSGDELDLLIGSEGTLVFITAVQVRLDLIPPDAAGLLLGLADLGHLPAAVTFLDSLNPSAVELLDRTFLDLVRTATELDLPKELEAVLIVEFERELSDQARDVVREAATGARQLARFVESAVDRTQLARLFRMRQLASPVLAQLPETRRSLQVIEDACVPLERLGDYVAGVRATSDRLGIPVAIFGHAGDGHVHVNALPDLSRPGWREVISRLLQDVTDLVVRLGGTPSGEHGDGRLRAGLLTRVYGEELVRVFADIKRCYDPLGIFNPGVIIPAADWDPTRDLKVGPDAAPIPESIARRLREIERTAGWATPKTELWT